ncbi:MAG TPA: TIGR02391 family protein [Candidatus Paceibacterota bacterium]
MKKRRKKAKVTAAPKRRRYTPREQQVIKDLAQMLGDIVPATSRGEFSLQSIAKRKGLGKFFKEELSSKSKQFAHFITELQRHRPRTLKVLVNDILADAVEKRRLKGNPILRPEADALKAKLLEFGVNLSKEMDELNLPTTRPNITPPPKVILQSLNGIGLHPLLMPEVLTLFAEGHINEAVRKSGEKLEAAVMRWSGERQTGRSLMATVFNKDTPKIDVALYHGSEIANPIDEREGFMLVAMGTMQWCKNIVGHGDVAQMPPHEGAARIIMVSHMMQVIDIVLERQRERAAKEAAGEAPTPPEV